MFIDIVDTLGYKLITHKVNLQQMGVISLHLGFIS